MYYKIFRFVDNADPTTTLNMEIMYLTNGSCLDFLTTLTSNLKQSAVSLNTVVSQQLCKYSDGSGDSSCSAIELLVDCVTKNHAWVKMQFSTLRFVFYFECDMFLLVVLCQFMKNILFSLL